MKYLFSIFRGLLIAGMLFCLPLPCISQKVRILPPKRPVEKPTRKPKCNPARKPGKSVPAKADGSINGHEYVDLGLPSGTKWAVCNVGASSSTDYGDYFGWGEVTPTHTSEGGDRGKEDIAGDPSRDAARALWGSTWRLPTAAECEELVEKCKWTWMPNPCAGYKVTGPSGKSVFFPASGYYRDGQLFGQVNEGRYWSSTPHEYSGAYCKLEYLGDRYQVGWAYPVITCPVRPVSD